MEFLAPVLQGLILAVVSAVGAALVAYLRSIAQGLHKLPLMIVQINRLTDATDALLLGDAEDLQHAKKRWRDAERLTL